MLKGASILITIFSIFLVLTGCDPGSTIDLEIANKTKSPIIVKYKSPANLRDTSTLIAPDSTKIIQKIMRLGYVDMIIKSRSMDSIPLYQPYLQKANIRSKLNLKDKKLWKFHKTSKYSATYYLKVDDSFFEQK